MREPYSYLGLSWHRAPWEVEYDRRKQEEGVLLGHTYAKRFGFKGDTPTVPPMGSSSDCRLPDRRWVPGRTRMQDGGL